MFSTEKEEINRNLYSLTFANYIKVCIYASSTEITVNCIERAPMWQSDNEHVFERHTHTHQCESHNRMGVKGEKIKQQDNEASDTVRFVFHFVGTVWNCVFIRNGTSYMCHWIACTLTHTQTDRQKERDRERWNEVRLVVVPISIHIIDVHESAFLCKHGLEYVFINPNVFAWMAENIPNIRK